MLLMTAANKVTSIRFLLCIVYFTLLTLVTKQRDVGLLTVIFILNQIIAWSDLLDGYLARKYNKMTRLGALLDPIADKLLMSAAFISLIELGLARAWMIVIIIGR